MNISKQKRSSTPVSKSRLPFKHCYTHQLEPQLRPQQRRNAFTSIGNDTPGPKVAVKPQLKHDFTTAYCNDELVINTLKKNIETIPNPHLRRIVIHKPFKLSMGQVLPHLELEFLDITNVNDFLPWQRDKLFKQISHRVAYKEKLEAVNLSQHIPYPPDHTTLAYTNANVLLPTTNIPHMSPLRTTVTDTNNSTDAHITPLHSHYNALPVSFIFPSMSHSSNVANPVYYNELNNKLLQLRARKNHPQYDSIAESIAEQNAIYEQIPSQYRGEKGWWQTFVRPSINEHHFHHKHNPHHPSVSSSPSDDHDNFAALSSSCDQYDHIDHTAAINLNHTRMISLSPIGSAYGSSSPLSIDPQALYDFNDASIHTGTHQLDPNICFRSKFPIITPFDQANAAVWLLDALGLVDYHCKDSYIQRPRVTEVLSHCPTILPSHLLEESISNYNDYMSQHPNEHYQQTLTISTLAECPDIHNKPYKPAQIPALTDKLITPTPTRPHILHSVIGSSMGGHSSLALCALYPDLFRSVVAMATTSQTTPHTHAIRSIQRRAVTSDLRYNHGLFRSDNIPLSGLQLSRMIGMLNYRSTVEFNSKFSTSPSTDNMKNDVEYYLQHHAEKFTNFNPLCYITLSKSMDMMDIGLVTGGDHSSSWNRAVRRIGEVKRKPSMLLLGIREDELIPYNELELLGQRLGKNIPTYYETITSLYGHDAFLIDLKKFAPRLSSFLHPTWSHTDVLEMETNSIPLTDNPIFEFRGLDYLSRYLRDINM